MGIDKSMLESALASIDASARKSAKLRAWSAAEQAVEEARAAGLEVPEDILGRDRYPELAALRVMVEEALAGPTETTVRIAVRGDTEKVEKFMQAAERYAAKHGLTITTL